MPKNSTYQQSHEEVATKYATDPQVIAYIRGFQSPEECLQVFMDHLEEVIAKKNENIYSIKMVISKKQLHGQEVNQSLINDQANLLAKRDFFLKVYTFTRMLSKKDWITIRT